MAYLYVAWVSESKLEDVSSGTAAKDSDRSQPWAAVDAILQKGGCWGYLREDGFQGWGDGGLKLHVVGQPPGPRPYCVRGGAQVLENKAQLFDVGHAWHPRLAQQQLCTEQG